MDKTGDSAAPRRTPQLNRRDSEPDQTSEFEYSSSQ